MRPAAVPTIETARLLLRNFSSTDLPDLAARIYADPEVIRFLPRRDLTPLARAERAINGYIQSWEHAVGGFAITAKVGGHFMGMCHLGPFGDTTDWEVEYCLGQPYWGQGFTTEAVRALLRFGFGTGAVERVVAAIIPENVASRRVLEHLRFVYERDVNYIEMTGNSTLDLESPILPYFVLRRDQFAPGNAFYRERGSVDHVIADA